MAINRCKLLALTLLNDAVDDVRGHDEYMPGENPEWLKESALMFFFSKESEKDARFWCTVAGEKLERFRKLLEEYK